MANENLTEAYLLNVPLENDYKNTLYFTSKDAQTDYFKSRKVFYFNNFSYQRKDEPVRIPTADSQGLVCEYDNLINAGVNYVMYRNTTYSTKWFYGFITDIKYISDGIVEIYIETDVIQTWLFDYAVKNSFVEREHVSDDTVGKHTVPEGLETGEYVSVYEKDIDLGEMYIVVGTTQAYETKVQGGLYGGCYSGVHYLVWKLTNYAGVNSFIKYMEEGGYSDAITSIFLLPHFVVKDIMDEEDNVLNGTTIASQTQALIQKNLTILGDYAPKNNKLFTYPFNYLLASNNNGGSAIYRYEHFDDSNEDFKNDCRFNLYGVVCPGGSIKLVPLYYKGVNENVEESINAGKFPICNWNTDVYTNWLTQNSVNIALSIGSSALQVAGGGAMMFTGAGALAGAGSMATGALGIAQTLGQIYQQSLVPPQAEGNLNCGDVLRGMNKNTFTLYQMTIKGEYAQIIDNYFHMFGYKVNRVKIPNKCHRSRFWYTKTIDVNIDGAIPNKDMQIIKDCYNNGITFWRNATEIQNYALDNVIAITEGAVTE